MIKKIKNLLSYLESISFPILASSITFYLLFLILPITNLVNNILGLLEISDSSGTNYFFISNTFSIITFVISIIIISIRFMNALTISSDIIYKDTPPRKTGKRKFLSLILTIMLVFLLVFDVVLVLFVSYFIKNILKANYFYFLHLVVIFLTTSLISSIIYKYIIPVKIRLSSTYYMSSVVSIIWYIITIIYNLINDLFQRSSYVNLYGKFAEMMLLIFWIYLMVIVYLLGLVFNYYFQKISGNKINKEVKILLNKER